MPLTSWVPSTIPAICFPQPCLAQGPSCLLLSGPFLSLGGPTGQRTPGGPGTHTHLGLGPLLCASPPRRCPQRPCPPSPPCAGPRGVCGSSGGSGPPSAQQAQASEPLPHYPLFPTAGDRPKPLPGPGQKAALPQSCRARQGDHLWPPGPALTNPFCILGLGRVLSLEGGPGPFFLRLPQPGDAGGCREV